MNNEFGLNKGKTIVAIRRKQITLSYDIDNKRHQRTP